MYKAKEAAELTRKFKKEKEKMPWKSSWFFRKYEQAIHTRIEETIKDGYFDMFFIIDGQDYKLLTQDEKENIIKAFEWFGYKVHFAEFCCLGISWRHLDKESMKEDWGS